MAHRRVVRDGPQDWFVTKIAGEQSFNLASLDASHESTPKDSQR